jgi:hypothetical protein
MTAIRQRALGGKIPLQIGREDGIGVDEESLRMGVFGAAKNTHSTLLTWSAACGSR